VELYKFRLIKEADKIGNDIWYEVISWKPFERDTIGKQLVRAADSISANLSEAYGRYSFQERRRFSLYSRGSLCETLNCINKAQERKLLSKEKSIVIVQAMEILHKRLNAYLRSLNNH
jgi:four helix bundle protein